MEVFNTYPQQHRIERRWPEASCFFDLDISAEDVTIREIQFCLQEIRINPLKDRYQNPFCVYENGSLRVVKDPRMFQKTKEPPGKKSLLLEKLIELERHPGTGVNERLSARARIQELRGKGVETKGEMVENLSFLKIDRKQLFIDNMDVLSGGRCGRLRSGMCGLPGSTEETLFVYVEASIADAIQIWIDHAQNCADCYVRVEPVGESRMLRLPL